MSKTFFTACDRGNVEQLQAALDSGIDPDCRDQHQLTGLIRAARKDRHDAVDLLLQQGADIDLGDVPGRTALFHGVCFNHTVLVSRLIERGANVNPVDSHGWTPLDMARSQRNEEIELLLERHDGIANNHPKVDLPDRFIIGAQFGGRDTGHIADLKRELSVALNQHCPSLGCEGVDEIGLCLRINGPICSFGDQCVDRVRHSTKQRAVTADIVIAEDTLSFSPPDTRSHLAEWVGLAITECIERLKKKKLVRNADALTTMVNNALQEFSRGTP